MPFLTHFVNKLLVAKGARNKKIFKLWLACYTQKELAEVAEVLEEGVRKIISQQMETLPKVGKVAADHLVDFTPPVYNVFSADLCLLKFSLAIWPAKAHVMENFQT